jgi:hypothetical protein
VLSARCRAQIEPSEEMRRRKWKLYRKLGAREQKARLLGGALIDEGLFNFLLTLYETEIPHEDLDIVGPLIATEGRELHIVEADESVRLQRIAARPRFVRREVGPEYFEKWSDVVMKNYVSVRKWIVSNCKHTIINS